MSLLDTASLVVTPNGTKAGKLYSVVPSSGAGDLSVTRATTATRVNSSGLIQSVASNVPRLDYTNGSCPSILVEPQRTNLLTYSSQFDAGWINNNANITTNSIVSPDGSTNADTINVTTGVFCGVYQVGNSDLNNYTMSIFAKKGTKNWLFFVDLIGSQGVAWFDLNNGTVGNVINGTAKIEDFGNGWYRCTYTNPNSIVNNFFQLGVSEANNSVSITSNGNVYLYGAQLEVGSYATSYIPTTSASVTRNADVISKTGISSLIGQTEGTLFLDINSNLDTSNFRVLANLLGVSSSYYITINKFLSTGNIYTEIVDGTQQALIVSSVNSGRCKIALAYKNNDVAFYINGSLIGTDSTASIPATSAFALNYQTNLGVETMVNHNMIALWKTRLTNTQLAQLTTI
jgi:hypothetical protein